jgi:hypothetical protein
MQKKLYLRKHIYKDELKNKHFENDEGSKLDQLTESEIVWER